jgi:hypothetical protein
MMRGFRRDNPDDQMPEQGQYGKLSSGEWFACIPVGYDQSGFPLVAGLSQHMVVEHEDGTITVSPSILVRGQHRTWHGYLERGMFRRV